MGRLPGDRAHAAHEREEDVDRALLAGGRILRRVPDGRAVVAGVVDAVTVGIADTGRALVGEVVAVVVDPVADLGRSRVYPRVGVVAIPRADRPSVTIAIVAVGRRNGRKADHAAALEPSDQRRIADQAAGARRGEIDGDGGVAVGVRQDSGVDGSHGLK